jgi:hypothetical protein
LIGVGAFRRFVVFSSRKIELGIGLFGVSMLVFLVFLGDMFWWVFSRRAKAEIKERQYLCQIQISSDFD